MKTSMSHERLGQNTKYVVFLLNCPCKNYCHVTKQIDTTRHGVQLRDIDPVNPLTNNLSCSQKCAKRTISKIKEVKRK